MTRAEKVAEAQRLRAQGLKLREIGERMSASLKTVNTWLCDPDLSRQRARRERYRGVCGCCGGPTDGSGGYADRRDRVCQKCLTWSESAILDAIRRWAEEHGTPPREIDWVHAAPEHPAATTVSDRFGWNEMLLRAGFKLRTDRRPETQEWIEQQIRAGVPTQEIADRLGVTPGTIYERLRYRGITVTALRNGAAA